MIRRPKRNNRLWGMLLALVCLVGLVGCKQEQAPPPPPPAKAPQQPKPVVQKQISTVALPPAQTNQLDFSTKKDPFKPFIAVKAATPAELVRQKADLKPVLPIHSFDVSQFRLIGAVSDPKGNKAMVVDPAGKGYVLRLGMTIGKNEGKITRIDTSGVEVVEQFRDENNKVRKETIRIPLLRKP